MAIAKDQLQTIRVLTIDDSKAVQAYLRDCFSASNVELSQALSGEEGLKLIDGGVSTFDVIFLDWEMPGLDGPEVLKKLRESGNRIPVIMVTSKTDIKSIESMLENGAQEYVMKPFTADIIYLKVEDVIGLKVQKDGAH
jgi:two-component system, chemotaxis family, chemotaxis protein CheY